MFLTGREVLTKVAGDWLEAPAIVTDRSTPQKMRSGQQNGIEYGTCISYSFQAQGEPLEGKECGIFNPFDTQEEAAKALDAYLLKNEGAFIVRYSESNSENSYLVVPQKEQRTKSAFAASSLVTAISTFAAIRIFRKN